MRDERHLSQAVVARTLGISPGQLGNIESIKRSHKYTLKQIYALSQLFNVSIEDVFNAPYSAKINDTNEIIEQIIKYQDD
jgi:transcriptional regulator with XRE-family HTH domain